MEREQDFDDFQRQPTLPWKLSDRGPQLAWFDSDQNGEEELWIGAGRGAPLGAFEPRNLDNGRLEWKSLPQPGAHPAFFQNDIAAFVRGGAWIGGESVHSVLLAGLRKYESPSAPSDSLVAKGDPDPDGSGARVCGTLPAFR